MKSMRRKWPRSARQLAEAGGGWLEADTLRLPRFLPGGAGGGGRLLCRRRSGAARRRPHGPLPGAAARPSRDAEPRAWASACSTTSPWPPIMHAKHSSLTRILIVDWDVHHGNGTQDIFWTDPTICSSASIASATASTPAPATPMKPAPAPGLGHTLNVPVRFGTSRHDYRAHVPQRRREGRRQDQAGTGAPQRRLRRPRCATRSARSDWKRKTSPT